MENKAYFTRILTLVAAAFLTVTVLALALTSCAAEPEQEPEPPAVSQTSRTEEATPETAPEATPEPTPEPTPEAIVPTSVTLEQEGGILTTGGVWTLHADVQPADAADKTLHWSSADESVATIDDSGTITALKAGQSTITVTSDAGGVSTTYNLIVRDKCSVCGSTSHTTANCPRTAVQAAQTTQAQAAAPAAQDTQPVAEQSAAAPAAEVAQPDTSYEVDWKGRRIYYQGDSDIPEGGVVQRPDGTRYIKGPRNVIFGYDSCPEDTDLSLPGNTPFTGDCVFCGDYGHDVYHCPILDAQENPDAFYEGD